MAAPAKPGDADTRSLVSMQELDPSPVTEESPDLESGEYFPQTEEPALSQQGVAGGGFFSQRLGLRGNSWDSWLSALQKYSTYPPTLFIALHFANTALIPLATRSVPASESYLLLTREIYQAPLLEHLILTLPVVTHIASGIGLRNIRAYRRARLYGAETRSQRHSLRSWPRVTLQARLGYLLVPLIGTHVLINRATPLMVDGGSSGIGLGYVAHGFSRSPIFSNLYYMLFVAVGVWHIVGGWAAWMGWGVTTVRTEQSRNKGSLEGYLEGNIRNEQRGRRQRRTKWVVYGIATVGISVWLAGALGIVGRAGAGAAWEAKSWDDIYSQVPVIGAWL